MHEIFTVIALDHPDWTIPWAGLGAAMLGVGSTLTGIAAIMNARKGKEDDDSKPQDDDSSSE